MSFFSILGSSDELIGKEQSPRRHAFHGPALLFFAALTFILVFPVVAGLFNSRVPGWEGDNLFYIRNMWWWKRALIDFGISPFLDITSYYPLGHHLAYNEMTPTNTLLFLPVTILFGPEFSYNFVLLFSFVATGFGTYLWIHYLTGSRAAGLLAGSMVAFLPFRFAHLVGHLPQMTTQWIPLALYSFERFKDGRTLRDAVWLGVWVGFTVVGCWYYGYAFAIVFPIYALARMAGMMKVWRERSFWTGIAASTAVAAVIVSPFLYQLLKLSSEGRLNRSIGEMQNWALNWYDIFIPNLIHPLWGEAIGRMFPMQKAMWFENTHTLSLAALSTAVLGLIAWRRVRRDVVLALAMIWAVSYVISLGPFLKSGDKTVQVPAPSSIVRLGQRFLDTDVEAERTQEFLEKNVVPIPLPSAFLYKFVPFTRSMRVMARFSIWTAFATAGLSAFGLITLMGWARRRWGPAASGVIPAFLIAVVVIESLSHIPTMPLGPREVDSWLSDQPADVVIVELPVDQGTRQFQDYWATQHRRRMFFGWAGHSFAPPVLLERMAAVQDFPAAEAIAAIRKAGVTYVLFTPSQIADWESFNARIRAEPALEYVETFSDVQVYRVVPSTDPYR